MKPKPYKLNGSWDVESCVFKLYYGKIKYVVVKAKRQVTSLQSLENAIASFIRGKNPPNPTSIYYHLLIYIKENPGKSFSVENVIYNASEQERERHKAVTDKELPVYSGYDLLKAEQLALDEGRKIRHCLNNNIESYIPQYNPDSQMYGWLTRGDVLNFHNWLPTRKRKKKKATA